MKREKLYYLYRKDGSYAAMVYGKRKRHGVIEVTCAEAGFLLALYEELPGFEVMARNYGNDELPDDWVGLDRGDIEQDDDKLCPEWGPFQLWLDEALYTTRRML